MTKKEITKQFFKAFASENRAFIESHMAEDFVFSSPPDPLLDKAGYFAKCWPFAQQGLKFDIVRVIESNDTVVVTYEMYSDSNQGRNTEVFTFVEDKIQRIEVYFGWGTNKNMVHKEIAQSFLTLASSGSVQEAYEKYIHPDFVHHNVYYTGGREALLNGMKENAEQFPNKKYETLRMLADGDLVMVHGKVTLDEDKVFSVIHIFRFEDDKIIEEWEASQEDITDSPNENGIF